MSIACVASSHSHSHANNTNTEVLVQPVVPLACHSRMSLFPAFRASNSAFILPYSALSFLPPPPPPPSLLPSHVSPGPSFSPLPHTPTAACFPSLDQSPPSLIPTSTETWDRPCLHELLLALCPVSFPTRFNFGPCQHPYQHPPYCTSNKKNTWLFVLYAPHTFLPRKCSALKVKNKAHLSFPRVPLPSFLYMPSFFPPGSPP